MAIDTNIDRRKLLSRGLGAALGVSLRGAAAAQALPASLVSAARIGGTDAGVLVAHESLVPFALPGRAHGFARTASGIAIVARRPGNFAAILDEKDLEKPPSFFAPMAGHRFAGHAALSPDGKVLATSEIDAETGDGAIALRDATSGALRENFSVGVEPHDLLFTGNRLVAAIGGIARAAEVKGPAINLGHIESSIAEFDPRGRMTKRHELPREMASLSLRHMALAPDGETLVVGMQDQDRAVLRPLMGVLRLGQGMDLLPLPGDDEGSLRSYIGSVAINSSGRFAAATSPKGGIAGLWRLGDGAWLDAVSVADICGLAADGEPGSFWASSGLGDVLRLQATDAGWIGRAHWRSNAAFDNHLLRL